MHGKDNRLECKAINYGKETEEERVCFIITPEKPRRGGFKLPKSEEYILNFSHRDTSRRYDFIRRMEVANESLKTF